MRLLHPLALSLLLLSSAYAADAGPRFEDFPAEVAKVRVRAKVQLTDAQSRKYATMLREGARSKPNFAGHYVLTSWGCGASCTLSAAIDAKTGAVTWLPFTVCCWDLDISEPLEFRLNSRLLVVHGSRDEQGGGTYFYQFDGQRFELMQEREKPSAKG